MAVTSTDQASPSGYFPFPANVVVLNDRTGGPLLAMGMLSLEGVLPVGTIVRDAGDASLPFSVLGPLLSGQDPTDSITSYRTLFAIDVPTWTCFIMPAEFVRFPGLLFHITDRAKVTRRSAPALEE